MDFKLADVNTVLIFFFLNSFRSLKNSSKETDAEFLPQKVSHILNKILYVKLRDNLSKPQRKALVQMKNNKNTTIYPFDKGSGFVGLPEKKCYAKKLKNS